MGIYAAAEIQVVCASPPLSYCAARAALSGAKKKNASASGVSGTGPRLSHNAEPTADHVQKRRPSPSAIPTTTSRVRAVSGKGATTKANLLGPVCARRFTDTAERSKARYPRHDHLSCARTKGLRSRLERGFSSRYPHQKIRAKILIFGKKSRICNAPFEPGMDFVDEPTCVPQPCRRAPAALRTKHQFATKFRRHL